MPVRLKTDREVKSIKKPGKHSLGGNVYLQVGKTGSRSYVARLTDHRGARRDIGLGNDKVVSLQQAREKALRARQAVADGQDPQEALNPVAMPTFEQLARQVHEQRKVTFKNAKHCNQWITTLATYAFPRIGSTPIDEVTSRDVMQVLEPIWLEKEETARRVLQRIAAVVSYAVPKGYRDSEIAVNGIRRNLPAQKQKVRHHRAVPVADAPRVYQQAVAKKTMSSMALTLLLLTGTRSGEARGARWSEFDLNKGIWEIPEERMKSGRAHRVPLCEITLHLLSQVPRIAGEQTLVFPNGRGTELSDTALSKTFKQIAPGFTVHGWRSTFKVWAQERTDYADEISECALAHVSSDKTRAAYARSDLFDRRRKLMTEWVQFLTGQQA